MKNLIYFLMIICLHFSAFAQISKKNVVKKPKDSITTESKRIKVDKHELKIGVLKPIIYQTIEVTYEYIPFSKLGFGTSVLFNTDKTNRFTEDFSITPFARFYFQDPNLQNGNGLFLEGFGKYISGRNRELNDIDVEYNSTAVGLSVGYKWLFKSGLIIEPVLGFSQSITRSNTAAAVGNLRSDISIGYRF